MTTPIETRTIHNTPRLTFDRITVIAFIDRGGELCIETFEDDSTASETLEEDLRKLGAQYSIVNLHCN